MRTLRFWATAPLVLVAASTALAQQCACSGDYRQHSRLDSCEAAYYDNKVWPDQYIGPARRGICQSIEAMTANGWRRQNALGKYHFETNSEQLNEAGRLKTEWILTQAPPHRRTVYVQRTSEPEQTAARVAAVQQYAAATPQAGPADVQETHVRDDGYPAGMVDAVFTGYQASRPTPALPSPGGGSSSGSAEE